MASLSIRTHAGARVVLACNGHACERETRRARGKRLRFENAFAPRIPDGTLLAVTATQAGYIGMRKLYRLSSQGVSLVRESCTAAGKPRVKVACQ